MNSPPKIQLFFFFLQNISDCSVVAVRRKIVYKAAWHDSISQRPRWRSVVKCVAPLGHRRQEAQPPEIAERLLRILHPNRLVLKAIGPSVSLLGLLGPSSIRGPCIPPPPWFPAWRGTRRGAGGSGRGRGAGGRVGGSGYSTADDPSLLPSTNKVAARTF